MVKYEANPVFGAIADPTRRAILDHMREGEIGAGELAERFPISHPAISRHLRILRRAGLVTRRVDAQRRIYSLAPEALADVDRWLAPYRLFWSARMVDLKSLVEREQVRQDSNAADEEAGSQQNKSKPRGTDR